MPDPTPQPGSLSLEGMHNSVHVPPHEAGFWEQWRAFVGPAVLISVGYMDPGNWGTDLQAGAQFKYGLLWVVGVASLMAIFMQVVSARLGVVTGKDLAQCCRDWYPAWTRWPNWLLCELAIGACDLAEVLGSAVALNLMFHIPLLWAVIITAAMCCCCWACNASACERLKRSCLCWSRRSASATSSRFSLCRRPGPVSGDGPCAHVGPASVRPAWSYVAIGIIGATVMPHNLYLHSALVQSRKLQQDERVHRRAIRFNTIDSTVALVSCIFRERGHSGAGGDGVLRQSKHHRRRRTGRRSSAPTPTGFAWPI